MTPVHSPTLHVELPAGEFTLDDVTDLAGADGVHRYELVDGSLLVMPPADIGHQRIINRLLFWLVAHGYDADTVLPTSGLRITERSGGRTPDLLVLRVPVPNSTVWVDPTDTLLVVEVVSPGSQSDDRLRKPVEYAGAGIRHYWRVERDRGAATVHLYTLGAGEQGEPVYVGHKAMLLDELVDGAPPVLS
jgi:Uma2 family endonuclease